MRLFVIEEYPDDHLFDLNGNVYHPKLRNEIEIGMIVGLRISEKKILRKDQVETFEDTKQFNRVFNDYVKYFEQEKESLEKLHIEIRKIIQKYELERNALQKEIDRLDGEYNELKIQIQNSNENNRRSLIERIQEITKERGKVKNQIIENTKHKEKLRISLATSYPPKEYLINYHKIPAEYFDFSKEWKEEFDKFEEKRFEAQTKPKPWSEIILFRIVKKSGKKLYGDVVPEFRRQKSNCSLKTGDRISFLTKNILFVPSELNRNAFLGSYYILQFHYLYYQSNKITDWDGVFLDPKILKAIGPGSYVRIQFKEKDSDVGLMYYVYILDKKENYLYGEILDNYVDFEDRIDYPIKIGCIIRFTQDCIIEVPIDWNNHITNLKRFRNKENWGYVITGYRSDENYYELK